MQKEKSNRQLKIEEQLKQVFADIITEADLFPNKTDIYVNVLEADVSPDIKNAKIIVDIFGIDLKQKKEIIKQLNSVLPYFRNEMSKRIHLKYIPEIKFLLDESVEKGIEVNETIQKSKRDFE